MKRSTIILFLLLTSIITNAQDWIKISAYYYQSIGIRSDATLWAWGYNGSDLFLTGNYVSLSKPTRIGNDADWLDVSMGSTHILALKNDSTLWAWGYNGYGQLGDGTFTSRTTPIQVGTDKWLKVSAGHSSSFAIRSDSTLWAWGRNTEGQVGDGTYINKNSPTQIGGNVKWQSVAAHYNHTLAIKIDKTLWAWGQNSFGQLGIGNNIEKNIPTQVGLESSWISLSDCAASQFSLAIKSDGTLWGWGYNSYGQLGNGTTGSGVFGNPTQVGTATDWQKVSTGSDHTLALKTDGSLWAWGGNYVGQLGDGTTIQKTSPVRIGTETNWQKIATGQGHSMALKANETTWAWGYNGFGELGDGTKVDSNIPKQLFTLPKVGTHQTVVATGGNSAGQGGSSSFSIGQVVYTASKGTGGSENQGVQHSYTIFPVGTDNYPEIKLQMAVYPNPTSSFVNLKIDASDELSIESLSYQLYDLNGKHIYNQKITDTETVINLENLIASTYFLTVTNKNKAVKTFKIIKNN